MEPRRILPVLAFLLSHVPVLAACPGVEQGIRTNPGGTVAAAIEDLDLDHRIEKRLAAVPVTPGLAVGVVRGGRDVYVRGFGYRDLESCAPVTPETVFYLLSVTKSFTGMAAAVLQEEGAVELDRSLSHFYPDLSMPEPINPAQTSVRDLLLHRAGFWSGGINYRTFAPGNLDNDGVLYLLEHHSRPAPITYRYSNMGYVIAGAILEKATGQTWRELLKAKIFEPLAMASTTPYIEEAVAGEFAFPYSLEHGGGFASRPFKKEQQMHAAGGAASNVTDLLRWLRANLDSGRLDGEQVLPSRAVRQAHAPQIQYDWTYYRFRRFAYGLGVHNADYEGDLLIHHFGGPIHVSFMPERDLGVVVLNNGTRYGTELSHVLAAYLYDLLLGKADVEARYERELADLKTRTEERLEKFQADEQALLAQRADDPLARPREAYAGEYLSDRLGTMNVRIDGERLVLTFGVLEAELIPFQEDSFLIYLEPGSLPETFAFRFDKNGSAATLDWGGRLFERPSRDVLD